MVYLLRKIDVRQTIERRIRDEGDKCVDLSGTHQGVILEAVPILAFVIVRSDDLPFQARDLVMPLGLVEYEYGSVKESLLFIYLCYLPKHFQSKLNLPRGGGGTCNQTCCGRLHRGRRSRRQHMSDEIRSIEIGAVQEVEDL